MPNICSQHSETLGKYFKENLANSNLAETFDISGKVDINNPIYKFYDKDLQKYLNKLGGKKVVDDKGVSWIELPITKEQGKAPVEAFKKTFFNKLSGPTVDSSKLKELVKDAVENLGFKVNDNLYVKVADDLIKGTYKGLYENKLRPLITVMENNGKIEVKTAYHEAFHYVFNELIPVKDYDKYLEQAKKDIGLLKDFNYQLSGYKTKEGRAEEYLADQFADYLANEKGYKGKYKSFFDKIKEVLNKFIQSIKDIYTKIKNLPNQEGGFIKNPLDDGIDKYITEGKARVVSRNGRDVYQIKKAGEWVNVRDEASAINQLSKGGKPQLTPELEQRQIELEIKKEALNNSPFNRKDNVLMVSKEGTVKELGDIKNKKVVQKVEDRIAESGIGDSAKYTEGLEKYLKDKGELALEEAMLKQDIKNLNTSDALPKTARPAPILKEEANSLEELGQQSLNTVDEPYREKVLSLPETIIDKNTPVKEKVSFLDYMRTPDRVLRKIGLGKVSDALRHGYDSYLKELPAQLDVVTQWSKEVPKESNAKIFKYLDGQEVTLNDKELKVAGEIKEYLAEWASRLNLLEDNQISHYITHIFEIGEKQKEFDEEIAAMIKDKVPGSVYDPFLEKRLGAKGYVEDTWRALDAYVKRAVRKANMDPALEMMKAASGKLEESQLNYVVRLGARINMRPTEWDSLLDNGIKQIVGYKFGQRPTAVISGTLRKMVYRGALGLNINSAVKNLTQGVNTFAKLGAGRTIVGYMNLMKPGAGKELEEVGVLSESFIQDRTLNATKQFLQKADKGLFAMFSVAEKINRGSAYFGAKSQFYAKWNRGDIDGIMKFGKNALPNNIKGTNIEIYTPEMVEDFAVRYAKQIVRDTQFVFGSIDTPVAMQGDIAKTLFQFGSFAQKQTEFLAEMAKNKEYAGIVRYIVGALFMVYVVGKVFNIKGQDFNPLNYFSRFGKPPALALPIEIIKSITNIPDQYGNTPTLKKKIKNLIYSGTTLVPAGVQIKKLLGGSVIGGKEDKTETTSTSDNPFNSL